MDRELDLRLKEIRARISEADPLLVRLLNFATTSPAAFQYGLVLILDGVTVMGIPGPSASTGKILDKQSVRYIRSMQALAMSTGGDAGSWPQIIQWYRESSPYQTQAENSDEAQPKVLEEIGDTEVNDLTELLDRPELAERAVNAFAPPKAFTLINARIRPISGDTWESVPNIRVSLPSVRAWWTFDLGVPEEAQDMFAKLEKDGEESSQ
jgi:hypothetical protein